MTQGIQRANGAATRRLHQNRAEGATTQQANAAAQLGPQPTERGALDPEALNQLLGKLGPLLKTLRCKEGDTLQKVAARSGVPLKALQQLNPGLSPKEPLAAGAEVTMPAAAKEATPESRKIGQQGNVQAGQLQALLDLILSGGAAALPAALAQGGPMKGGPVSPVAGLAGGGAGLAPAFSLGGVGADPMAMMADGPGTLGGLEAFGGPKPQAMPTLHPGAFAQATGADGAGAIAGGGPLQLGKGYESLNRLGGQLAGKDSRFSHQSKEGRAATALALAIGGTEVYSKGTRATDFFTRRGGTGNNMLGFGQFNLAYHANKVNTPEKYTKFMGDILTGKQVMPNSASRANHAKNLVAAVESGRVKNGNDLRNWMRQNRFGGSNWQGIDDGWRRVPGLGDQLVNFIRGGGAKQAPNA